MRGADPAVVLVPGVGMFSYGANKQTARVAGEFYVNAINVMRGAEALSTYTPIDEAEKFRIEYWALEEAKLQRMPRPKPLATRVALVTGAASGIGLATARRLAAEGACVVLADLDLTKAQEAAAGIGGPDVAVGVAADVSDGEQVAAAVREAVLAFGGVDLVVNNAGLSISKPLLETTERDWDLQHDVMAKGSFLVSRETARVMIEQGMGGDIVYISSKNSLFAGPNNVAYGATKADQAHQVRLLAAELGAHRIRVNGVNPDGVVRGSGIFAGGWGAKRAAVYGVPEEELGAVLRPAHPAQARGAARALRGRGLRAHRRRAVAAPRACTYPWTPASPQRSCAERTGHPDEHPHRRRRRHRRLQRARHDRDGVGDVARRCARSTVSPTGRSGSAGTLHWDVLRPVRRGARRAAGRGRVAGRLDGVGVDTWAVDYGLLDADGDLLGNPVHYRDDRTDGAADRVRSGPGGRAVRRGPASRTCRSTRSTSSSSSRGRPGLAPRDRLLVPDLLAYWLTGGRRRGGRAEVTNASTTQLVDATTRRWCDRPRRPARHRPGAAAAAARARAGARPAVGGRARRQRSGGPGAGRRGRLPRHGFRRGRHARRGAFRLRLLRHVVVGRCRAGGAPC